MKRDIVDRIQQRGERVVMVSIIRTSVMERGGIDCGSRAAR